MIRRTQLKRSKKPIPRGKRPNAKRPGPARRVSVVRDQEYMDWLKDKPCVACAQNAITRHVFENTVYVDGSRAFSSAPAHTAKTNGRSSKGPDSSCIPLCIVHHNEMDGRLNTTIVTKEQFAEKYGLDLAAVAAEHYERFKQEQGKQ